jgi:hypothetical protein
MDELEHRSSAKRGDTSQSGYALHECSAYKSRTDYHVGSLLYRPQHLRYLSWIMRVVAVHNDQYVIVACYLDNVPDQSTQASPKAFIHGALEKDQRKTLLPFSRYAAG